MAQTSRKNRSDTQADWEGGGVISLAGVTAGSTLVLCVWGYDQSTSGSFATPVDSQGQPVVVAVDTGKDARVPVRSMAWVLHNAGAGLHALTSLPALGNGGDGVAVLMEFTRVGVTTSSVVGAAPTTANATGAPWLTSGAVTMAAGAAAGDLLVACSFAEEFSVPNTSNAYGHSTSGWTTVAVQNDSGHNIAGEVCWRTATDSTPQTVTWNWSLGPGQDSTIFKAFIFALR